MSQNITRIKKRINTISSTRKITNSMKLVSSVKVRKLTKEFTRNKEFFDELNSLFDNALYIDKFSSPGEIKNTPFVTPYNEAQGSLHVVIMSNLGLCGSYNAQIYRFLESTYKEGDEIIAIGNKAYSYIKGSCQIHTEFIDLAHGLNIEKIGLLSEYLIRMYQSKKYKQVDCIYAKYINSLAFKPEIFKILPLDIKERNDNLNYGPIYEVNKEDFINGFVPIYIKNVLLHLLYESCLCEETSRRNSMDNANKNIDDLMYDLTIEYNKARQSSITSQITEIVGGAESIKNSWV